MQSRRVFYIVVRYLHKKRFVQQNQQIALLVLTHLLRLKRLGVNLQTFPHGIQAWISLTQFRGKFVVIDQRNVFLTDKIVLTNVVFVILIRQVSAHQRFGDTTAI